MAPETKSEIVQVLESSREQFHAAASGLSDAQALAHTEEGCWSVLQCVEHVTTVEELVLTRLEKAAKSETPSVDPQREVALSAKLIDRSWRVRAPEWVQPTGRFANLREALDGFQTVRTRTIQVAQQRSADLPWLEMVHPFFGKVNGSEMMRIIAGHSLRHAGQILEIRAAMER